MVAARRELEEEVGVAAVNLMPICVLPFAEGVNLVFKCNNWTGRPFNAEPDRCAGINWFPWDALPSNRVPWLEEAIRLASSSQWYSEKSDTKTAS